MSIWTDLNDALKYDYQGPIREQLNNSTLWLANIEKTSKDVVGQGLVIPLRVGRNRGVGSRGSGGDSTLPTAGKQKYKKATTLTKDTYADILIYGKEIRTTRNDTGAFLRAVRSEVEGAVKDAKVTLERELVMSDTTGALTTATTTANAAVVGVVSTQYLEEGMIVDIDTDTGCVINSIDSDTQITLSAAVNHAAGDVIRLSGVSNGDEHNGLILMLKKDAVFMGIDPTAALCGFWNPNSFGTAGAPIALTELDMLECTDAAFKKGGDIDMIMSGPGGRRAFYNMLQSYKRFAEANKKMELKGGFNALVFSGGEKDIPFAVNRYWPETSTETSIGYFSRGDIALGRMNDWEWMEEDGNVLARQTGAGKKEAYEGTLVMDCEQITYRRGGHTHQLGVLVA